MINIDLPGGIFNYRVAGVCIHDGHVLTHKSRAEDVYALPGGRVEIMESSEDALCREMREELGVVIHVERLLWVMKNVYEYQCQYCHELGLYFLMTLDGAAGIYDTSRTMACLDAPELTLQWLPLANLSSFTLLPPPLVQRLSDLPATPQHILDDRTAPRLPSG